MLDILSSFLEAKWCVSGVQTLTEINCPWNLTSIGAGEGIQTLDFNLGKVALYP
jgi:membrane-associated PAP2 superfamily phosphatase